MRLSTPIEIEKGADINHTHRVLMFGSCFSENIGNILIARKFRTLCNPLGILYNPLSILSTIQRIAQDNTFTEEDIFEQDGVWNSLSLHSKFAQLTAKDFLRNANDAVHQAHKFLCDCDVIFITLGTAWAYEMIDTQEIVANCHKLPSQLFQRRRLTLEETTDALQEICHTIREINPETRVIFTVSPIRHLKDGAHGNQISKSTLLLSIDEAQRSIPQIEYFPAYEIMMDELRDYRFYASDMTHPNETAIQILWEKFTATYMTEPTLKLMERIEALQKALSHRPFQTESANYRKFQEINRQKLSALEKEFPFIDFSEEREKMNEANAL